MTTVFVPIENLDKTKRYSIVGSPRCGSSSLAKYLTDRGYDINEMEVGFTNIEFAENFDYYDRTPIIVTRNPVERAYSDYKVLHTWSLKEACGWSYFKAGLQMWDALIYSLEYLKTIPDFPHIHKGIESEIPKKIKAEIIDILHLH